MDLLIPSVTVSITIGLTLLALFSIVTRPNPIHAGVVDSFGSATSTDPSAETISTEQGMIPTKFHQGRAWQLKTLTNLYGSDRPARPTRNARHPTPRSRGFG